MTNGSAPIQFCDRGRRGAGEWGRPLLDERGFEDPVAFANGCARHRWTVGRFTTQGTLACPQLAITAYEQNGTPGPSAVFSGTGARYASAKQTRAAQRRHHDPSGTGRGPDDVEEPGRGL
jgi:hypothetical protein